MFFKGACLRYDAVDEILIARPFDDDKKCWNAADWTMVISSFFLFVPLLTFLDLVRKKDNSITLNYFQH